MQPESLSVVEETLAMGMLIAMAWGSVYAGSRRLVRRVLDSPEEAVEESDSMTVKQAATFPLQASVVLFSCYLIIQYVSKALVNIVAGVYLTLMTAFFLRGVLVETLGRRSRLVAIGCLLLALLYFYMRFWMLNNLFALVLAVISIENVDLGSFRVAAILLLGLFVYDIFWVFGSSVMVTVALSIDGPVKLDAPRRLFSNSLAGERQYMSLGLGDIVIPGFYVAFLHLFSSVGSTEALKVRQAANKTGASVFRPHHQHVTPTGSTIYFQIALVAYLCSLVNTMVAMKWSQYSQPALLYIVPWLLMTTLITAAHRGDLKRLWEFSSSEYTQTRGGDVAHPVEGLADKDLVVREFTRWDVTSSGESWWHSIKDLVVEYFSSDPDPSTGVRVIDRRDRKTGCVVRTEEPSARKKQD